jgi:hypothetical protein
LIDGLVDSTWVFSTLLAGIEIGLLDALDSSCTAAEAAERTGITDDLAKHCLTYW